VDDEIMTLEAMKHGVSWSVLNISDIYTAMNIQEAKQILNDNDIDIIICDIEMPKGSGLDLISWVVEYSLECICIFLTCHSKFDYAKKAISLGVMDYLLKPVDYQELEQVILNAIDKKKEMVKNKRANLMLSEVSSQAAPEMEENKKNQRVIEDTKEFIYNNIGNDITRDDVSAHVFLNPDYLSRIFKKDTGYSISEYILKTRISVACDLLLKTQLSISKIAASCGYTHMAHFSKMFKKEVGLTPVEYRFKYKNG